MVALKLFVGHFVYSPLKPLRSYGGRMDFALRTFHRDLLFFPPEWPIFYDFVGDRDTKMLKRVEDSSVSVLYPLCFYRVDLEIMT